MTEYSHNELEARWNQNWFEHNLYAATDFSKKEKRYVLVEFPYPSGSGLHCGHAFRFTMPDIYARKLRMSGYNVLFPIGWDAFGLPAENYAVKTGVHPAITTKQAIETYRTQVRRMGYGFDWNREIDTTEPGYYKWTQWIFLKFFEAGLAELREQPVWWCEALKTVLANEEVLDDGNGGKISERGEHPVAKRMLKQWVLKMPAYAEKLLTGLNSIEFPEAVKLAQADWIGKSEGARISFPVSDSKEKLDVFTTRPDTIFGATFMVVAPEHPLVDTLKSRISNWAAVDGYRTRSKNKSDLERKTSKQKSGQVLQGVTVDHPLLPGTRLPLFIADYVLMEYGTGAIMAVPAHDERDFEFATTYKLPIVETIRADSDVAGTLPFVSAEGVVVQRPEISALFGNKPITASEFKNLVVKELQKHGLAEARTTFKMRDWLFSRQRYWGEPIPLVHRENGEIEALCKTSDPKSVAEKLPLKLPEVPDYQPSSDGSSPLAKNAAWMNTLDSSGQPALRETNTMPNWAGSCWYYLRYIDPKNDQAFASPDKLQYWLPVDKYFGGSEHTTMHLLYSRFWHLFLYDQGLVPTPEPYAWRMNGGILLGSDNQKMSKSVGNVINPDDKIDSFGADALRLYISFMGPYDGTMPWSESGLKACRRLVERIFALESKVSDAPTAESLLRAYHKCVRKVTWMIDNLKANTAVAELMIFVREAEGAASINREQWKGFVKLIAPFIVFGAEELWQRANGSPAWKPELSVHVASWPTFDEALAQDAMVTLGVQVNGKLRDQIELEPAEAAESVRAKVLALPGLQKWIAGKEIKKFIYVPGRIVNLIV